MAVIKVNFFKKSGKWYAGDMINIGNLELHDPDFLKTVMSLQKAIDKTSTEFNVVTSNLTNDSYVNFHHRIFKSDDLKNIDWS